jgi:hypothetical protein
MPPFEIFCKILSRLAINYFTTLRSVSIVIDHIVIKVIFCRI